MKNSSISNCKNQVLKIRFSLLAISAILGLITINTPAQGNSDKTAVVYYIKHDAEKSTGNNYSSSIDYSKLRNTASLEINGSSLKVIPPEVFKLSELEELNVNSSGITSLPSDIKKLYNLRVLNLGNTSISELPEEIRWLKHLKEIHLPFSFWGFRLDEVRKITNANIILD
jgi:Leucine-rich repeat (LRR) protein